MAAQWDGTAEHFTREFATATGVQSWELTSSPTPAAESDGLCASHQRREALAGVVVSEAADSRRRPLWPTAEFTRTFRPYELPQTGNVADVRP